MNDPGAVPVVTGGRRVGGRRVGEAPIGAADSKEGPHEEPGAIDGTGGGRWTPGHRLCLVRGDFAGDDRAPGEWVHHHDDVADDGRRPLADADGRRPGHHPAGSGPVGSIVVLDRSIGAPRRRPVVGGTDRNPHRSSGYQPPVHQPRVHQPPVHRSTDHDATDHDATDHDATDHDDDIGRRRGWDRVLGRPTDALRQVSGHPSAPTVRLRPGRRPWPHRRRWRWRDRRGIVGT